MKTKNAARQLNSNFVRSFEKCYEDLLWPGRGLCPPQPEDNRRYLAVATVLRRMPKASYMKLAGKVDDFLWFIPDANVGAIVMPFPCTESEKETAFGTACAHAIVLYLGPALERRSIDHVVACVAHELAHIVLEHDTRPSAALNEKQEAEAWLTVKAWGFKKEERAHKLFYSRYHSQQRGMKRRLLKVALDDLLSRPASAQ